MSKTIEEHVNAVKAAKKAGIIGVYSNEDVQVIEELIVELADGNYSFASRDCDIYPFEVSTTINGIKYFTICDENELKNEFGGNPNELTTAN